MASAEPKTKKTKASVAAFIASQPKAPIRSDCRTIVKLMKKVTGERPAMWGPSIIGFGEYQLLYKNGSTADWPVAAFSPRKQNLTVYLMPGFERHSGLMKKLGKHSATKSCLYFKSLNDIDLSVLEQLIILSMKELKQHSAQQSTKRTA